MPVKRQAEDTTPTPVSRPDPLTTEPQPTMPQDIIGQTISNPTVAPAVRIKLPVGRRPTFVSRRGTR